MTLIKDEIYIDGEGCYDDYPLTIPIESTIKLNNEADRIQKAKGELPLFDDSDEYDNEDWYDFHFETNGREVTGLYFDYGIKRTNGYVKIDIDETSKRNAWEVICKAWGGEKKYKKCCHKFIHTMEMSAC